MLIRLGVGVWVLHVCEGVGDGGPGLRCRGREARLLIPLVFVMVGRGGRENLPAWGVPVHQKGTMALGAQP